MEPKRANAIRPCGCGKGRMQFAQTDAEKGECNSPLQLWNILADKSIHYKSKKPGNSSTLAYFNLPNFFEL